MKIRNIDDKFSIELFDFIAKRYNIDKDILKCTEIVIFAGAKESSIELKLVSAK